MEGLPGGLEESFMQRQARLSAPKDQAALLLFAVGATGVLWRAAHPTAPLPSGPFAYLATLLAFFLACILWIRLAPASWQRLRMPAAMAARLAPVCGLLLWGSTYFTLLDGSKLYAAQRGPLGMLFFLFSIGWSSGALLLAQSCIGLHLPPLLSAAIQLAGVAATSAANWAHCATAFMHHPLTAARVATAYVWLEPLIAPLEPLLWLSGIGPTHPQRRCHCVLLAVQVWGGLVAPLLLVAAAESRAYRAYRLGRLRRLLEAQSRQQREEDRHWTRAAAVRRRRSAEALGRPLDLSDIDTSSSSGPDSPEAAAAIAAQANALVEAPAPPGLLLRGDWQYEAAYRGMLAVRQLAGWRALPLGAALCLLYAWHVLAYPW